jgi:hypothetical protein
MERKTKVLRQISAAALIFGFASLALAGCDLFDKDEPGTDNTASVTFVSVTANGSPLDTTTELTLSFSAPISGLSAADIALSGLTGVSKGSITGSNPYALPISGFTSSGTLTVAVAKAGFAISGTPKEAAVYYTAAPVAVTFVSVTANGASSQSTTELTLSFSAPITGLSAADITLSGLTGVSKGSITGSNPYTLPISGFSASGTLSVAVAKAGFAISGTPKEVAVYYVPVIEATPDTLASTLVNLHTNTASSPYNIAIRVSNTSEFDIIKTALRGIPNKYVNLILTGSTITIIPDYAFDTRDSGYIIGCPTLTGIVIPNGVTYIGERAFSGCNSLASVIIPNGVTSIGINAFNNCHSLVNVTLPDSLTSIGMSAFFACDRLVSINIPSGVTTIEIGAFSSCESLTSLIIPNSVTSIKMNAFEGCFGLTSVTISNSVTSIGENAFSDCFSLTSVTIPNSVTSIEMGAFTGCTSLASVNIGNGVTSIGDYAFAYCSSLTSVTLPNSVTRIGGVSFGYCSSLGNVTIPGSVTSIEVQAFISCTSLTSVDVPNSVTIIGEYAFRSCTSLTAINVNSGNNAYTSENGVLYNKNKTTLIAYPAGKKDASFTIPDSVTIIEMYAFELCTSLTSLTIPNNVTSIKERAFLGCTGLANVSFGSGVSIIGSEAFNNCTSLTSVTFQSSIPSSISNFPEGAFPGDLRTKYFATGGGIGTYTRPSNSSIWTKQ